MATDYFYQGFLPFTAKSGWENRQTDYFTLMGSTYQIRYSWNATAGFYTAIITRTKDNKVVANFKLIVNEVTIFAKDPNTKETLFVLTPLAASYGKVSVMVVWRSTEATLS